MTTPRKRTARKTCICEWCKKSFETWNCRPGRFCSSQCRSEFASRQPRLSTRKPEIYIIRTCLTCGKEYKTNIHHVRLRGSNYCSRKCMGDAKSVSMRDSGNPNYRGGTIRWRGPNWGKQSRAALKRDGYKCQICHKKLSRRTHDYAVHHIKAYREFNKDWETANQLTNLVTLCRRCHTRVEAGKLACPKLLL